MGTLDKELCELLYVWDLFVGGGTLEDRDAVEVPGDPNRRRVEENRRDGSRRLEENCQSDLEKQHLR